MNNESKILNVSIDKIIPNRFQPRLIFDEKSLNELSESIKEHGIIQPLIVRPLNDKYEIIAGERRYKAATMAGLTTVPILVTNLNDSKSAEVAIVENIQRKNLNPIEEAKSYKRILDRKFKTQEELSKVLGVNQSTISNKLRLLTLTKDVQEALSKDKISERHARSLLKVQNESKQIELLTKTINNKLTVKDLDEEIKKLLTPEITTEIQEEVPTPEINEVVESESPIIDVAPSIEESKQNEIPKEEPIESLDTLDSLDITKPINKKIDFSNITNILTPKNEVKYPSLDDLITNMDIGIEDDFFNPFKDMDSEEEIEEPKEEEKQNLEVAEAVILPEKEEVEKQIIPNNLESIKTAMAKLVDEIKEAGFNVNFEDYDFSDLYQIIIKINK